MKKLQDELAYVQQRLEQWRILIEDTFATEGFKERACVVIQDLERKQKDLEAQLEV